MKVNRYPDGTSYINVNDLTVFDPNITVRINTYEDLWHLNQLVDAYNDLNIKPVVTIPNLLDAQADRRFHKGESSGLKLVCKFLNSMDVEKFRIFHPHNSEVVEALVNNVEIIDNSEFITEVLEIISDEGDYTSMTDFNSKLILMSSDAGGFKPLSKLCDTIGWEGEMYSASKARSWDEVDGTKFIQQIDRQDFGGKDILIVDDISVYGGTFKGLSTLLEGKNCGKIYLAVSHMTIANLGKDNVCLYYDKVFSTNSKHEEYKAIHANPGASLAGYVPTNLEIIKLF